jgi:hypothetical protein
MAEARVLAGKVALVTGASRGVGAATAPAPVERTVEHSGRLDLVNNAAITFVGDLTMPM